jgi:regulator of cell morphogenesis and NO signaling
MTTTIEITDRTIGEIAVEMPLAIRVFEAWKIDYCCGGMRSLADACAEAGRSVDEFAMALDSMATVPADAARDWSGKNLSTIASGIVTTFHACTREELMTLEPLADKVLSVHGERRSELAEVRTLLGELKGDMLPHMLKEEQVLFPYVTQLEEANAGHRDAPTPFFGTVKNPVRKMMEEHDRVGELLARLRVITDGYQPPESACFSYRELYRRFAEFETLTHEHIHIENNLYFPRAIELEDRTGKPASFGDGCGSSCAH